MPKFIHILRVELGLELTLIRLNCIVGNATANSPASWSMADHGATDPLSLTCHVDMLALHMST